MQYDTDTLEDNLAISYKRNIPLPYDPAITLLGINQKDKLISAPNLHTDAYGSFNHSCKNSEATKMPFYVLQVIDEQIVTYPHNGMPRSDRK